MEQNLTLPVESGGKSVAWFELADGRVLLAIEGTRAIANFEQIADDGDTIVNFEFSKAQRLYWINLDLSPIFLQRARDLVGRCLRSPMASYPAHPEMTLLTLTMKTILGATVLMARITTLITTISRPVQEMIACVAVWVMTV